jgi:hypothetical protein
VLIAVCLFQVCVLAGAATANSTAAANGLMMGRLMMAKTEAILVNGNNAYSGTTILSGSQLQTPADVNATVQLGSAGTLYIEPNTNLTVTFDKTDVAVKVTAGKAFVAANAGVRSSVTSPDGTTTAGEPGVPPVPKMSHKAKTGWIAAGVIIPIVIIVVVVATNGS